MSGPYRTAPPSDWPRSLRAAFLLGYRAAGSSLAAALAALLVSLASGITIGAIATRVYMGGESSAPPPACSVEATWNPLAYRGAVTLYASRTLWFDKTVAYLPDVDAALATAEKVGCKVQP